MLVVPSSFFNVKAGFKILLTKFKFVFSVNLSDITPPSDLFSLVLLVDSRFKIILSSSPGAKSSPPGVKLGFISLI